MQEFTVTESADNDIGCDGLLYIHKVNTTVTLYRTDTNEVVDTFTVENRNTYPRFAYVGIDVTNGKLFNIFWDNVNHDTDRNYTYVRRVFVSNDRSTISLLNEAYDGYSAYISSNNYPNGWEDNYGKVYPHPSNPHVLAKMVDPVFLGLAKEGGYFAAAKSLVKAYPEEKVGVFCKKKALGKGLEELFSNCFPKSISSVNIFFTLSKNPIN